MASLQSELDELKEEQFTIEATFVAAMGDMLKDGYWSDQNYAPGQEESLYLDALDVSDQMGFPAVKYSLGVAKFSRLMGYEENEMPKINDKVHVLDTKLGINDEMYVSKTVEYLDDEQRDTVELSNDDLNIGSQSFQSVLSRVTELADLVKAKEQVYGRAEVINSQGEIGSESLNGTINVLRNKILGGSSNWYTDENGNIVFEAADGESAMMLAGDGFMIANGKRNDGSWNWRTFGTGEGFTADAIRVGFLNADRIESGAITTSKLSSDVGTNLDISSNQSITLVSGEIDDLHDGTMTSGSVLTSGSYVDIANNHVNIATGGSVNIKSGNNNAIQMDSSGVSIQSGADLTIDSAGSISVASTGTGNSVEIDKDGIQIKSGADIGIAGGNIGVTGGGDISVSGGGDITMSGGSITVAAGTQGNAVEISDDGINVKSGADINVDSTGSIKIGSVSGGATNAVVIDNDGIEMNAGMISLESDSGIEIKSGGTLDIVAGGLGNISLTEGHGSMDAETGTFTYLNVNGKSVDSNAFLMPVRTAFTENAVQPPTGITLPYLWINAATGGGGRSEAQITVQEPYWQDISHSYKEPFEVGTPTQQLSGTEFSYNVTFALTNPNSQIVNVNTIYIRLSNVSTYQQNYVSLQCTIGGNRRQGDIINFSASVSGQTMNLFNGNKIGVQIDFSGDSSTTLRLNSSKKVPFVLTGTGNGGGGGGGINDTTVKWVTQL